MSSPLPTDMVEPDVAITGRSNSSERLRYLSRRDVHQALPSVQDQVRIARESLRGLATQQAEQPPKLGVHLQDGGVIHAMPALYESRGAAGLKWVSTVPSNPDSGLRPIDGLVLLNDATTGYPIAIMDGMVLTGARTAAVSGVALTLRESDAVNRVAFVGAGLQASFHLEVVAEILPGVELRIHDRHADRAEKLAAHSRDKHPDLHAQATSNLQECLAGADIVITMGAIGSAEQIIGPDDVEPHALFVAVDGATHASATLARRADLFLIDDQARFEVHLNDGDFHGYPRPGGTIGQTLGEQPSRDMSGLLLVTHLGSGIVDVLFAQDILQSALEQGFGTELAR